MATSRLLEKILNKPGKITRKTWREALRNHVGPGGEKLWAVMLDIAEGRAWTPVLASRDGIERLGEPVVPTTADRLSAAKELAHMMFGKPVPMTEVQQAEIEAQEMEAARSLTDAELQARVKRVLAINPGPEENASIVADVNDLQKGTPT